MRPLVIWAAPSIAAAFDIFHSLSWIYDRKHGSVSIEGAKTIRLDLSWYSTEGLCSPHGLQWCVHRLTLANQRAC